uniref:Leucine-rich repeat-containing N-terminal plant-type domain-containing protein n=1 Tax=Aegilops tauschii subsp. strangulata TaxID=200361 RepID=A0A453ND93_AEGTS
MQPLQLSRMRYDRKLPISSLGIALVMLMSLASITSSCTEQEKASLLKFLAGLSQDGGLAVLWQNGTDCCTWEGITCNMDGTVTLMSRWLPRVFRGISHLLLAASPDCCDSICQTTCCPVDYHKNWCLPTASSPSTSASTT